MSTFTIRDLDEEKLDSLKEFTRERTASKALISAASQAMGYKKESEKRKQDCLDLMEEIKTQQQLISDLLPLCIQVQEIAGQTSLLNDRLEELTREYSVRHSYYY